MLNDYSGLFGFSTSASSERPTSSEGPTNSACHDVHIHGLVQWSHAARALVVNLAPCLNHLWLFIVRDCGHGTKRILLLVLHELHLFVYAVHLSNLLVEVGITLLQVVPNLVML